MRNWLIGLLALVVLGAGCATVVPIVRDTPVTGLSASATTLQAILTWASLEAAVSYNLYWSNTSGVTKANVTKLANVPSAYTHPGLTTGLTSH